MAGDPNIGKSATVAIWNGTTLTASAADTVSDVIVLGGCGADLSISLQNGATGPTLEAQVIVKVSHNGTRYFAYTGALKGSRVNNDLADFPTRIPQGYSYLKLYAGSNTGQDVDVYAHLQEIN